MMRKQLPPPEPPARTTAAGCAVEIVAPSIGTSATSEVVTTASVHDTDNPATTFICNASMSVRGHGAVDTIGVSITALRTTATFGHPDFVLTITPVTTDTALTSIGVCWLSAPAVQWTSFSSPPPPPPPQQQPIKPLVSLSPKLATSPIPLSKPLSELAPLAPIFLQF
ncbi:unnamed protein product [Schistocephalus solidus]|uniref:Uncharacterized protein n=1 Tax=Schistocephalus solidus TaxID=70667 RepID=A0A183T3S6_SCHSO|nr:unnamed protein product [Schistocephalus solidus]